MMALLNKIQANESQLEKILAKTEILKEPLNPFLCKILVAELLYGRKMLNGQSKPVQCVLGYQDKLTEALSEFGESLNQQKVIQYKGKKLIGVLSIIFRFLTCHIDHGSQE